MEDRAIIKTKLGEVLTEVVEHDDTSSPYTSINAYDITTLEMLGYVNFSIKYETYGGKCWIYKIEAYNPGTGLGKALNICMEKYLADRRVKNIEAKYYPTNEVAQPFYLNNGYRIEREDYEQYVTKTIDYAEAKKNYERVFVSVEAKESVDSQDKPQEDTQNDIVIQSSTTHSQSDSPTQ